MINCSLVWGLKLLFILSFLKWYIDKCFLCICNNATYIRCSGSLGQGFGLLLWWTGSHSVTYLCDNITVEKPSKQLCSQTKAAASTAKCSLGVIIFQFLVATIVYVHIFFSSHSYVTCYAFNSVMIYWWSFTTTGSSFNALALKIKCNRAFYQGKYSEIRRLKINNYSTNSPSVSILKCFCYPEQNVVSQQFALRSW